MARGIRLKDLNLNNTVKCGRKVGWLERQPVGGYAHLTWWEGADCHNVDAWESEAAFNTFGADRLGSARAKLGIAVQPEATFHPAHEVYLPNSLWYRTIGALSLSRLYWHPA